MAKKIRNISNRNFAIAQAGETVIIEDEKFISDLIRGGLFVVVVDEKEQDINKKDKKVKD